MNGKNVRLFLVDGTAGGLITAEIVNWTGHILRGKREKIAEIRRRPEASRTGIYVLLGEDPENPSQRLAYIGQSDNVATRLLDHVAKKDFWNEVLIVTSKDRNLTSAHVRYLEAHLTALARDIGRATILNVQSPTGGAELPESDASDMQYFIGQIRVLFPVLGVDLFRGRSRATSPTPYPEALTDSSANSDEALKDPQRSPIFHLRLSKRGADAKAQVIDGEFTLLAGSFIAPEIVAGNSLAASTLRQFHARSEERERLVGSGAIITDDQGRSVLSRDVVFASPSAAGCLVVGRASINGRREWMSAQGVPYGEWENMAD